MVQKTAKRGIQSGNTIRASDDRFYRQYSRRPYLVRKSWMSTNLKETILDDMNMNLDDILYSLSKKGRWELPNILKEAILAGDYNDSKSNIKLIVSHNIAKTSNTIGYYASKGKTKKVEGTKTYFNGESVVKGSYDDRKASMGEQPIIQIEVVYPIPKTSSMVRSPRDGINYFEKRSNSKGRKARFKKERQKLTIGQYCEYYDEYDDEIEKYDAEEEIDEESALYLYGNSIKESLSYTELLEDIMVHAAQKQSLCETRKNKKKLYVEKKFETKDKKIFEPVRATEEKSNDYLTVGISAKEILVEKKMDPVYVILPKEAVEHDLLKERYKNKYIECPCFPRKFIIDVSERMKQRAKTSGCWKKEYFDKWDFTSCVVFVYDQNDANNTDNCRVYRVSLNMVTKATNFRILTMIDYFEGSVEDVLQRSVVSLDMLSTDAFVEKETEPPRNSTGIQFHNLNRHQKLGQETFVISLKSLYTDIFNSDQLSTNRNTKYDFGYECICKEYCGICIDLIAEGGKPGTALSACGHWFCDECWIVHSKSRMEIGCPNVTCPEYECGEIANAKVLMSFMNAFEVLNIKRRACNNELQSSGNSKWCPNPHCRCIIKVTDPEKAKDLTCQCGTSICFQCLQMSHWPVSCETAELYWKKMKRLGDDILSADMLPKFIVRGKQCPKCKSFVVKKQGWCYSMRCVCGANFCWGCLDLNSNHYYAEQCYIKRKRYLQGTESVVVSGLHTYERKSKLSRKNSNYKKALDHRCARHPEKIYKLRANAREINLKCKNIAKRKGPRYFSMFANDKKTTNDQDMFSDVPEVETKIGQLLTDIISINIELHHIAEYSYILLDKLNKAGTKCSIFRCQIDFMGLFAAKISDLLSDSTNVKDCRPLLIRLLEIKQKANDITKAVFQFTKKLDL